MFDAIVLSNGWDDATAALQLLSHLEGEALNVAHLVPESRRAGGWQIIGVNLSGLHEHPERTSPFSLQNWRHWQLSRLATWARRHDFGSLEIDLSQDIIVVSCVDIWTVCHRKLRYGILLIDPRSVVELDPRNRGEVRCRL